MIRAELCPARGTASESITRRPPLFDRRSRDDSTVQDIGLPPPHAHRSIAGRTEPLSTTGGSGMSRFALAGSLLDRRRVHAAASRSVRRMLGAAAVLVAAATSSAAAQGGSIAGVVVAEGTLTPIAEAQVVVAGTTTGTTTDAAGRFRLNNLTGTDVSIEVRRLGY